MNHWSQSPNRKAHLGLGKAFWHWLMLATHTLCSLSVVYAQREGESNASSLEVQLAEESAFKAAAAVAGPSVVRVETFGGQQADARSIGTGTGTIIDSDGWILTSGYLLRDNPSAVTVLLQDGTRCAARVSARDFSREIVLLKIDTEQALIAAKPGKLNDASVGDWVLALGRTFGADRLARSNGILSAKHRIWNKAIQTDAKISPLNYGGPLINLHGEVLGILTPLNPGIATEGEVQQWYDSGIGFAIPMQDMIERLESLKSGKSIDAGKLGVRVATRGDYSGPIKIAGVTPGSPAAKVGIRADDILVSIENSSVGTPNEMRHALGPLDAGKTITLTVERAGQKISFSPTLVSEIPTYHQPYLGVTIEQVARKQPQFDTSKPNATTNSDTKSDLEQSETSDPTFAYEPSLVLSGIVVGSPADKAGLRVDDRISALNDERIKTLREFVERFSFLDFRSTHSLEILRDGTSLRLEVALEKQPAEWDQISNLELKTLPTSQPDDTAPIEAPARQRVADIQALKLKDVTNSGFRLAPKNQGDTSLGLLMLLAEAGAVNQKPWVDAYEKICLEQGFVLAVLGSAKPNGWTFEEREVVRRAIQQLKTDYEIDENRILIGGVASGATLSFIVAFEDRKTVRAYLSINGRLPKFATIPQCEPLESLSMLFIGDSEEIPSVVRALDLRGYHAMHCDKTFDEGAPPTPDETSVEVSQWLQWLSTH